MARSPGSGRERRGGGYPFSRALVTGASSGIGRAMAEQLAAAGVAVIAVARRGDRLDELAAGSANVEPVVADLTDRADLARIVERISGDDIDLVVNNAGFGTAGNLADLDPERIDREVALNVGALTQLSAAALSNMVPQRRGWLLNVSSVASFQPAPKLAVYVASKAYVTNLTESLHEEVRGTGVCVSALCPGLTRTEFAAVSNAEIYTSRYPEWVFMSAEEVAIAGLEGVVRNKVVVVPGLLYKTMVTGSDIVPRRLRRRLASLVQR